MSFKLACFNSVASLFYTYCICPVAQEPNRGVLQFNSWEHGFKDYIDQKYHLYDNADEDFYNCIANKEAVKHLKPLMYQHDMARLEVV